MSFLPPIIHLRAVITLISDILKSEQRSFVFVFGCCIKSMKACHPLSRVSGVVIQSRTRVVHFEVHFEMTVVYLSLCTMDSHGMGSSAEIVHLESSWRVLLITQGVTDSMYPGSLHCGTMATQFFLALFSVHYEKLFLSWYFKPDTYRID